jgi:tape measure domain-containing protein
VPVAESLGQVGLTVTAETAPVEAAFSRVKQAANSAGQAIIKGLSGGGGANSLTGLNIKLNTLQQQLQSVEIGTRRFRELRKEIEATQRALDKANGIGTGGGPLAGIIGSIAGIGVGAAAVGFLQSSIKSAVELETITRKLSNTLGEQGAGKALAFTKGLADQLGLSFTTLSGSFASFTAAASAASVPLVTQRELFASVAKAAQQLGLSNDEISGSLLALQQVASKGTVQMEELRGQLGERLPIAFGATAKGLGITQQELIKLVESGRLTADVFFPALTKGLNELTSSSAGAPTTAQNLQVLQNAWKELQTEFGTNLLPTVTENVKTLTAVLEGIGRKQLADRLGFGTGAVGFLGILSDQAITATVSYRQIQQQLNLTNKEADRLFSTAQKNLGIKNLGFADEQTIEKVVAEYERLAQRFRDANPDQQDALSRANAEAERLRQITLARVDAETKLVKPAEDRLKAVQQLQGLEGLALAEAREQQKVDAARVALKKALDAQDRARPSDGVDTAASVAAAAAVRAAGLDLQAIIIESGEQLKNATKEAASSYIQVIQRLTDARLQLAELRGKPEGLNRFLSGQEQFDRTRSAIISLGPELNKALEQGASLLRSQGVGIGRELFGDLRAIFDNAVTGRSANQEGLLALTQFIRDVQTERGAEAGVNQAERDLAEVQRGLITSNVELREAVSALVQKDWNVQVNLNGATGASVIGDVAGALG